MQSRATEISPSTRHIRTATGKSDNGQQREVGIQSDRKGSLFGFKITVHSSRMSWNCIFFCKEKGMINGVKHSRIILYIDTFYKAALKKIRKDSSFDPKKFPFFLFGKI